jgi:hypothetical protein
MDIYCLSPINPMDPDWRASTHREAVMVRAGSEQQARSLANDAFATTLARPSPGARMATPLWGHPYAVRVEIVQDQRYRSGGPAGILEPWGYI